MSSSCYIETLEVLRIDDEDRIAEYGSKIKIFEGASTTQQRDDTSDLDAEVITISGM